MRKHQFGSSMILSRGFERLKKSDGLSLRKWSELVKINSATLNQILNSKILAPKKHLLKLAKSLHFDSLAVDQLQMAYQKDILKQKGFDLPVTSSNSKLPVSSPSEAEVIDFEDLTLLRSWLHLALLEYTTTKGFGSDLDKVAKSLGSTKAQIKLVIEDLKRSGYLSEESGKLVKKTKKLRVSTQRSREIIRNFHAQMLKRAIFELENKTSSADFEKRLISGYTLTADPDQVEPIKKKIELFFAGLADEFSKTNPREVYQMQVQLFPLSKKSD